MYLHFVKTQVVKALKETFDNTYPKAEYRGIHISIEYPVKKVEYPAIWVDFDPVGPLQIAGIAHAEVTSSGVPRYRWRFAGSASFTIVAMTALERDRLFDEMVAVLAFSRVDGVPNAFRETIERGEFIGMNFDFDQVDQRGFAASQGTPWGGDEMIYEGTIAMEVVGEFVSTAQGVLLPVSQIKLYEWVVGTVAPTQAGGAGWHEEIPTQGDDRYL